MIAAGPSWPIALLVVALLTAGLVAFSKAASVATRAERTAAASASTPSMFADIAVARLVAAAVAGFAVLLATGWVLLAVLTGLLTALWGRLLHDGRADEERHRVEGIAKWLEDLRDTLRGSSMGAEEALEHVAARPPEAIAVPLRQFLHRRRQGFRTEDALDDLAEALAHPTADAAIAAIRLVVGGTTSAGRLHGTVQALAAAARDEVTARERIDRTRAIYQGSMRRLVLIGAALVGYLRLAGGDLLQPYGTAVGQVVLALPLAMWTGCMLWLRSLCRYDLPARARRADDRSGVAV
ncbi:MAG: type II secretion system F family protein [Ilumatobacteraceae bacterium]